MRRKIKMKLANETGKLALKRKAILTATLILLFTLLAPHGAFSQQISDLTRVSRQGLNFSARALGMGNTYSTIGYDFSALRFNPATMALNQKFSYTMTLNANAFRSASNYHGNTINFTTTSSTAGQVGLIIPFHLDSTRNLVVGLGYTQAKDFNLGYKYEGFNGGSISFIQGLAMNDDLVARALGLSYPTYDESGNFLGDNTILRTGLYEKGYLLDEGGLIHFSFGASVETAPNVFFGVSGSYNTGPFTSDLELSAVDSNDVYPTGVQTIPDNPQTDGFVGANYRIVRQKQYTGWDVRFGILYRLENFIGLSAAFKTPAPHKVDEDVFITGRSQFAGNHSIAIPETTSTSSYSFSPPTEITLGAMMNLWILTGTLEASYVDYSDVKITSGLGDVPDRTKVNKQIKDQLKAVVNLNAGVEFRLPFTGLSARAGAIYQPSPYGNDPARFSQKFLTAGFGINSGDLMQFDLAYAYGWRGENTRLKAIIDDSIEPEEETISYQTALFTMKFNF
jgi:hypothetical protein